MHPDQTQPKKLLEEIQRPLNTKSTTVQWLNRQTKEVAEQRLWDIMQHNIAAYGRLIEYVGSLPEGLRMVRLGSDCLPVYTQQDWRYYWRLPDVRAYAEREFAKVGETARRLDVRLSMHPGQFTVLASDDAGIVERSIEEFEYHADMVRWMGYGKTFQDFKCNVHISGRKGPEGIRQALRRLSPEARNCITIENDENKWGIDSSLELVNDCALVLDLHHHLCREGEYLSPNDDRFKRIVDSWRGVRPAIHYSYSREEWVGHIDTNTKPDFPTLLEQGYKKGKLRAHSEYYPNNATNEWALSFLPYADIMAEVKFKNIASIELYNYAVKSGAIQGNVYTHREFESSTSSEYLDGTLPVSQL
jgi:UV DNA damage repair endonuclease